VYNSHPGMSRLVALKSEHKRLKSSHDNLMRLYRRLKQGSALEVSAIVGKIKTSDEILDMSAHKARISPSLNCAQLANDRPGSMHQNEISQAGSLELMRRETSVISDQTPKSTSSYLCTSRNADSTGLPLGIHDNGYHNDSRTINWRATFRHVAYTNSENESAMGFSVGYEPLLKGLLSCNLDRIRLGFTILRSWSIGSRNIHGIEEFDHLFSVLYYEGHKTISRSRLCEMCAIAAISGQYVRQLLAPGLINYWYGKLPFGVSTIRMDSV
jgi:hypothetical protein